MYKILDHPLRMCGHRVKIHIRTNRRHQQTRDLSSQAPNYIHPPSGWWSPHLITLPSSESLHPGDGWSPQPVKLQLSLNLQCWHRGPEGSCVML